MGYFTEAFDDAYDEVIMEGWGVDANSTTLKKEMKWYNKFVQQCRVNADTVEAIDARLDVLKECSKQMKETRHNINGKNMAERLAYGFKALIPFNNIARLIAKQDLFAGGSGLGGGLVSFAGSTMAKKKAADAAANAKTIADIFNAHKVAASAAKTGMVAAGVGTAINIGVRIGTFNQMLDRCIKNTDEAIEWLENKKKELKSAK